MNPILWLLSTVLSLYSWVVIIYIVMYWLIWFKIINAYQPFVRSVMDVMARLVEPALKYVRKVIPMINGVDLSPVVLLIGIEFVRYTLIYLFV